MKNLFNKDPLEFPTIENPLESEKSKQLSNKIGFPILELKSFDEKHGPNFKHPSCDHTGGCGSKYHQGNGYCYFCSICNPDNPDSY